MNVKTIPDAQGNMVKPLELLVVSDNVCYAQSARSFFEPSTDTEGKTLYDVKVLTKDGFSDHVMPQGDRNTNGLEADVILFDFGYGELTARNQLPLLERYLSHHQRTYAIASVDDEQWQELLRLEQWGNLHREVADTAFHLTQSLRLPTRQDQDDQTYYSNYFDLLTREFLGAQTIQFIRELKTSDRIVRRVIRELPTAFANFSTHVRQEHGTPEVKAALDTISDWNADQTLERLNEMKGANAKHSVPQHCYPPFESLGPIQEEDAIRIMDQVPTPSSLYVHLPFCANICSYCDYSVSKDVSEADRYLGLLKNEMQIIYDKTPWAALPLTSIHIGGGTPTAIGSKRIEELGKFLDQYFDIQPDAQIGFEASPETTKEKELDAFLKMGANRASIGLQSLTDETLLRWLHRLAYTGKKGMQAVDLMLKRWPGNTNIDVMYGFPGQTIQSWEEDVKAAVDLGVPSITFYELRVSPRTRFAKEQDFPGPYQNAVMRLIATEHTRANGYRQVSDNQFVRSVKRQSYVYKADKKRGGSVLGIGLSSYSLFPGMIYFNHGARDNRDPASLEAYGQAVEQNRLPVEIGKLLSEREQMSLFAIQGLKLSGLDSKVNGIDIAGFQQRFSTSIEAAFPHTARLMELGLLKEQDGYLGLTYKGLAFEDPTLKTFY